jgi:8-oxo-dGTP diphosphatase
MLKEWLVDLNEMEEDVPHRPGKLYKFRSTKVVADRKKLISV